MQLYILRPIPNDLLWKPWYDKNFGFVVRAETSVKARELAAADAGAEGKNAWLEPEHSSCNILYIEGVEEVIIHDFAAA